VLTADLGLGEAAPVLVGPRQHRRHGPRLAFVVD
jgi:hypothetical protein